jgi:hypothetical protein
MFTTFISVCWCGVDINLFPSVVRVSGIFTMVQPIPLVVSPNDQGCWVCYFSAKVGISSLVCQVVCCDKGNLWVVLIGCWYDHQFIEREPLSIAPS